MSEVVTNCPNCGKHCPIEAISCHRGADYFLSLGIEFKRKEKGEGHHHHHRNDLNIKQSPE